MFEALKGFAREVASNYSAKFSVRLDIGFVFISSKWPSAGWYVSVMR